MATWKTSDVKIMERKYPLPKSIVKAGIGIDDSGVLTNITPDKKLGRYKLSNRKELIWFILHMPIEVWYFDYKALSLRVRESDSYVKRKIEVGFPSKYVGMELSRALYWEGVCATLDIIENLSEFKGE